MFIGYTRPAFGAVPPLSEMLARYYALLVSGQRTLPDPDAMAREVARDAKWEIERFAHDAPRLKSLLDYSVAMDTIAAMVGCQPPLQHLFYTQPLIWLKVLCGSLSGAQFRLRGPGATPEYVEPSLLRYPIAPPFIFDLCLLGLFKLLQVWKVPGIECTGQISKPWPEVRTQATTRANK